MCWLAQPNPALPQACHPGGRGSLMGWHVYCLLSGTFRPGSVHLLKVGQGSRLVPHLRGERQRQRRRSLRMRSDTCAATLGLRRPRVRHMHASVHDRRLYTSRAGCSQLTHCKQTPRDPALLSLTQTSGVGQSSVDSLRRGAEWDGREMGGRAAAARAAPPAAQRNAQLGSELTTATGCTLQTKQGRGAGVRACSFSATLRGPPAATRSRLPPLHPTIPVRAAACQGSPPSPWPTKGAPAARCCSPREGTAWKLGTGQTRLTHVRLRGF